MSFKLKKSENVSAGIRRIARQEIDDALDLLGDGRRTNFEEMVHELRKSLKKVRAVARLVRDELGEEIFQRENDAVRTLGHRLAPVRDATVRVSALDHLRSDYEKDFPADEIAPIRKRLASRVRSAVSRLRRGGTLSAAAQSLEELRRRVRAWPLQQEGFVCLESGLRRAYRQGREGQAEAYGSREDDLFHEWRKRAKDLRYHVALLEPIWPEVMTKVEGELHQLTDHLGDDHDYAELRRTLTGSPKLTREAKGVTKVIELIDRRRSELQTKARPVGSRVYAERPRAFSRRIDGYWKAWRACPDE